MTEESSEPTNENQENSPEEIASEQQAVSTQNKNDGVIKVPEEKVTDEIIKPKKVAETDIKNARLLWAATGTERGAVIKSWDLFQKVKKNKIEYDEVQRLLRKYFEVVQKKANKNLYKWNEEFEIPDIEEPEFENPQPPKRRNIPEGVEFTQAGYIQRWMDEKEKKARMTRWY
jgi:hypothetical protein